jgi:8-amino-7-oxononanoate synthase
MTSKIRKLDVLPSRVATFDGDEYLFFSGTSYLGIGHQAEFRAALSEGIGRYGTVFSASRNNNLQLKIYEEAENFLSEWTGAEGGLTVTSGLLAGQLAVNFLKNPDNFSNNPQQLQPLFIYAPSAHPAVWERTPQYIFKNRSDFETNISDVVKKERNAPIVIVSNAIDMLTCETFGFDWILELPDNQDITLLIDDSHGIGVTGEHGSGIFRKLQNLAKPNVKIVVIASLAKALGIPGGVILSDKKTVFSISQNPLFVGASPIIPAYLYAFLLAQPMYDKARQILTQNIQFFKKNIDKKRTPQYKTDFEAKMLDDNATPIFKSPNDNYPVFYAANNTLFDFLYAEKIFISHFAYPKPHDPPITRVVLSALHSEEDLAYLTAKISDFYALY